MRYAANQNAGCDLRNVAQEAGVTAVVEDQKLVGVISDGDYVGCWRNAEKCARSDRRRSHDGNPRTIAAQEFAATALALMEEKKITSLMVVSANGKLEGLCTCMICGAPSWCSAGVRWQPPNGGATIPACITTIPTPRWKN